MAEQEIVRIINIKTGEGITSVKDLKKYINELRDSLVVLDKDTDEYKKTVDELTDKQKKLTEVQSAGKSTYTAVGDSIKGLRLQLKALNNTYDELSAADRNSDIGKNLLTQIQAVDKQLKELEGSTGRFQRNVGDYRNALAEVTSEYKSQKAELRELKTALEQLEPGTKEYNEAFMRASEITHNLTEQQELLKYSSADLGTQLSNIRGIATGMVAGLSAVNAAMGLFGKENEDVHKAMLKVQQTMAIVQGLQGLDGMLKRTRGLSTAMKAWYTSTVQVTAAEGKQAIATAALTKAQQGLNAAMKANPIGAVLTAVLALTAAIGPLINLFDKLSGKTQRLKEAADASNNVMADLDKTISNMDRDNRLEILLMQASGLSQLVIIEAQINQERNKVKETTDAYGKVLLSLVETLGEYNDDCRITTGTLKELGVSQQDINDLMSAGTINIVESDKAMKKLVKSADFKTILDNVISLKNELKGLEGSITDLQQSASAATVSTATAAQNEAKRRIEAERNAAKQIAQAAEEALMTEEQLLTKRYNENKKKLEKFHIDTKNLTEQYYRDLKEIQEKNKIDWGFSTNDYKKMKEQLTEFFNTYKKNSLQLLTYQKNNTIKMLNSSKQEEYKYFEDLYEKGRITEEQLNQEKVRINEKYALIIKEVNEKYLIEYSQEVLSNWDKTVAKVKSSTEKALTDLEIMLNDKFSEEYASKSGFRHIIEEILGLSDFSYAQKTKEQMDEVYAETRKGLEKIVEVWKKAKDDTELSTNERYQAEVNYTNAVNDLRKWDSDRKKEETANQIEEDKKRVASIASAINTVNSLFDALADKYAFDIELQRKHNKITAKEAEKQYKEKVQPLQIAQATIQTLQGSVAAFASALDIAPPPYNFIIGGALASAVMAMGAMQIAKIRKTNPYDNAGGSSSASVPAPSTDYAYQPMYVQNQTSQSDTDNLRNAISAGMSSVNLSVSVTEINDVQKRVKVRENESDF